MSRAAARNETPRLDRLPRWWTTQPQPARDLHQRPCPRRSQPPGTSRTGGVLAGPRDGRHTPGVPSEPPLGVIFDVDGVLPLATVSRQLRRLRALLIRSIHDLRSVQGMPHVLRSLAADRPGVPVFYLTALPVNLVRPLASLLRRDGYPSGTALMAGRALVPRWLGGGGTAHKRAAIERLANRFPQMRWVLIGDDGGHDPSVFVEFARCRPDRVAVIALRQVLDVDPPESDVLTRPGSVAGVCLVEAPNGEELLPRLRAGLGREQPQPPALADWFLTEFERGNEATRLRAWTEGNAARSLVHGAGYFPVLAEALAGAGAGDSVLFAGWRADADELLTERGPTVVEAVSGAAQRGARVRGLLWRSHSGKLGYHEEENRALALAVAAAGGEVLLDQRVRALGSHHQKLVVVRHPRWPQDDVAFLGGIDVDRGSRDDAVHRGDPQSVTSSADYGRTPAVHDVQVELRGPAVREVEDAFRERWEDPAAPSRLPWHAVPDRIHGLRRSASPLPAAAPDPPPAGTCAVQLLCTYPRRRPPYPHAPLGERSIARGYAKALGRAQRMVYVEDQYLWSVDVARVFAAALRRSPRLHLIAVVPRHPDVQKRVYLDAAGLGHAEALAMVHEAGGDRVQVLDVENHEGVPVYVHSKLCVIDDVWAAIGSDNFNTRSWTHDSELAAAVVDEQRDVRPPADPAGLGDGARRFARHLRLELMREHLDLDSDEDLLDPDRAAEVVRDRAAALDAWHAGDHDGQRPPGRLRRHTLSPEQTALSRRHRWFTAPAYRSFLDPEGRPLGMRLRRTY